MIPRIQKSAERKLIGKRRKMSLAHNTTGELWRSFMMRRKDILNTVGSDLYSLNLYPDLYFEAFNPQTDFEKWAAVEVENFQFLPEGMEAFLLPEGQYAVFHYKGLNTSPQIFEYIYRSWLPASGFLLDNRPHFEILGVKYKNGDPDSEEEIWIPVKNIA